MAKTAKAESIIDRLREAEKQDGIKKGPKCTVCKLPAEAYAYVHARLEAGVAAAKIGRALKASGYHVSGFTICNHIREGHHVR